MKCFIIFTLLALGNAERRSLDAPADALESLRQNVKAEQELQEKRPEREGPLESHRFDVREEEEARKEDPFNVEHDKE